MRLYAIAFLLLIFSIPANPTNNTPEQVWKLPEIEVKPEPPKPDSEEMTLVKTLDSMLPVFKTVESNHRAWVTGDSGRAIGILQIHRPVVIEVNQHYGTKYSHHDMFDSCKAEDVYFKYMTRGYHLYKKRNKTKPTKKEMILMWNWGIHHIILKKKTNNIYYNKYLKHG